MDLIFFTLIPGLILLVGITYALIKSLWNHDYWLGFSLLLLVPMFFHQYVEISMQISGNEALQSFSLEIAETTANIIGTIVVLLLAQARKRLETTLEEKEILLEEINHRVKNNLQLVISLLQNTIRRNPEYEDELDKIVSRVKSMALHHEKIQTPSSIEVLGTGIYLEELIEETIESYESETIDVDYTIVLEAPDLDLKRALHCGLIINELVLNALKYGIDENGGEISIELQQREQAFELKVSDSGGNLPDQPLDEIKSTGLGLVETIAEHDLNGTVSVRVNSQTQVKVEIPR